MRVMREGGVGDGEGVRLRREVRWALRLVDRSGAMMIIVFSRTKGGFV